MIHARPTTYKGIPMRSRLEATWAARFDNDGHLWEYGPRCFANETGQYLPDFHVIFASGARAYVEIKPPLDDDQLRATAHQMSIIWDSDPNCQLRIYCPDWALEGFHRLNTDVWNKLDGYAWPPAWSWLSRGRWHPSLEPSVLADGSQLLHAR